MLDCLNEISHTKAGIKLIIILCHNHTNTNIPLSNRNLIWLLTSNDILLQHNCKRRTRPIENVREKKNKTR